MLTQMLPEGLSAAIAALLVACSLITSLLTASMGAGGGVMLLIILSLWLPPLAVIPVHGLVQLGSNAGRALMTWRHVHWPTVAWMVPGIAIGIALGGMLLVQLPAPVLQLSIALFVLYLCWGPPLPKRAAGRGGILVAGAVSAFAGLFVGANGPLVAAFLQRLHRQRFAVVATFALCMVLQHAPKALIFSFAGFEFARWLPLIVAMIASGALGTWLGLRVLGQLSDQRFRRIFTLFLTLLSLRLLWQAATGLGVL